MENYDNIIWITNNSTANMSIYSDKKVTHSYTDESGKIGEGFFRMEGLLNTYTTNARVATLEDIGFPTVEQFDTWPGEKEFLGWAWYVDVDGAATYNPADGSYDLSGLTVTLYTAGAEGVVLTDLALDAEGTVHTIYYKDFN